MRMQGKGSVMFITPSAYVLSGLATWLDYMEPGLTNLEWDVSIGLVEGARYHLPEKYLSEHPNKNWIPIKCKTGTREGRFRAVEQGISKVKPDIVISVNIPDAILGADRLRQKNFPSLKIGMAVHGIQPDLYDDVKAYGSFLDGVFCVNKLACKLVVDHCQVDSDRVYYVPCGVNQVSQQHREPEKKLNIAYVGRLEQDQKRIFDLPEILSGLDDLDVPWELFVAGIGPDEQKLRDQLALQILAGKVHFLGLLPPYTLQQQVFENVDVLLLTSSWETGPLVVWEAMASGVAVVSSNYIGSGLESALHNDCNALMFPVGDVVKAAQQLQRLWQESGLVARLRQKAFKMISESYTVPVSVAKWDRHLSELLKQSPLELMPHISRQVVSGRLDRLLGCGIAEAARSLMGSVGSDNGPGGEWPHSHGRTDYWDEHFWAMAKQLDRREGKVTGE